MTRFLDVPAAYRLIADVGVPQVLRELAQTIRADYLRWPDFDKSPRLACHSSVGVIELMPVADNKLFAFKYVNGHPINAERGIHTVMAFGALAAVDTGYPLFLSELTLTTALRTAATSALVARTLARPESRTMALIGNGAQSEFQAIAFHELLGIDEIRVFDVDASATNKLVRNLAAWPSLKIVRAASTADAVRGADIVTTVTADKAYATIITPDMVEPGMHINAVGGDCPGKTELHVDVLRMGRVIVEYEPQTRIEGDIQQMPADSPVVELWRVLRGEVAGRERADQITIFDSVGFALEDYSALRYLHALCESRRVGIEIALIPPANDPKNLFDSLASKSSAENGVIRHNTIDAPAFAR
ncbi:ornithine cyclodeaminase [Paraburkholderia sp. BCC1876]|uniref:ornithine cyclodeaminase n=1 Tax=Paraburkholderia sp. BCC1876 TaxID=2676303 RepID=UPI00158FC098|nr:ornithine cyclodeaminase [Paraburkholderia sp. BCC1876]